MRVEVMGVPIDNVTMEEALEAAIRLMEQRETAYCVTPNAEIVYETLQNERLRQIVCQADLVLPDGAGVVLGAKILGTPLKQKVAGIDFAGGLMAEAGAYRQNLLFSWGKAGRGRDRGGAASAEVSGAQGLRHP